MNGALAGEWTKLSTLRSPGVTVLGALAALSGIGAAQMFTSSERIAVSGGLGGLSLATLIVTAMAVVATTGDHTTGTYRLSVMAEPRRGRLLAAKIAVVSAVCGVAAAIGVALLGLAGQAAPNVVGTWSADDTRRLLLVIPAWMLAGVIAVAVGTLLRRTALAVTLLMVWPLAAEPLISVIPKIGEPLSHWLPFTNLLALSGGEDALTHGVGGSLAIAVAWALGLALVALVVDRRRSA